MASPDRGYRDLRNAPRREPSDRVEWRGRRRRPLWRLHHLLDRLGPGFVIAFLAVVVLTGTFLGVRYIVLRPDAPPIVAEPSIYEGEPTGNFGRELSPAVRMRLARFGIPLRMGPNGVPLIQVPETGEVREATPLEMAFPEATDAVQSSANPDSMLAAGPHGTAVRWWQPRHLQDLPQPVYVDRVRWYTRQEHQLNLMIRDLAAVLEHVTTTPVERWDDRWGYRLEQLTDAMTDKYAFGSPDLWPLASRNIVCGQSLDLAMTSGIGSGCPSEDFVAVVDAVYVASGEIVARLNRVGKAAQLPYDNVSGNLFQGTEVSQYQAGALADIERLMAQIETFFEEIHRQGEAHGHYLDVRLP